MTKPYLDPETVEALSGTARKERRYWVAGTGHGWTLDRKRAEGWAQHRSKITGHPVTVLFQDVEMSVWQVASNHTEAEMERYQQT